MDIQLGSPEKAHWLWGVLALIAVTVFVSFRYRGRLRTFASANLVDQLIPSAHRRGNAPTVLTLLAMILIVIGMIDIRWGKSWREVPQQGIEAMVVLDVSRSMWAEDVSPNRLSRAKQQISDLVDEMAGDRVGLITFAGEAKRTTPLTRHYSDFKNSLRDVGTHSVQLGGSRLGNALQLAGDSFLSKTNDHKAIIVWTDGEDQESEPIRIAKQLHAEKGIRVFTIGLGDIDQGAQIPMNPREATLRRYLKYDGETVWSKLNGKTLREVAEATEGAYIPAGTKQVDMADVYYGYIAAVGKQSFQSAKIHAYIPRFQVFAAPALALLILAALLPTFRRPNQATPVQDDDSTGSISEGGFT